MEVQERRAEVDVGGEATPRSTAPAAWIGSLDDFDAEQRYGGWVDLTMKPREVMGAIKEIIDGTPPQLGRRWDICATRGLGGWSPSEHDGLPVALQVATGVTAFGEHYGGLASTLGADSPALGYDRYQHSYLGSWASPRAFVEQVASESGWQEALDRLPRHMRPYVGINYAAMARDAKRELTFVEHADGVWVYDPRVW